MRKKEEEIRKEDYLSKKLRREGEEGRNEEGQRAEV